MADLRPFLFAFDPELSIASHGRTYIKDGWSERRLAKEKDKFQKRIGERYIVFDSRDRPDLLPRGVRDQYLITNGTDDEHQNRAAHKHRNEDSVFNFDDARSDPLATEFKSSARSEESQDR